MHISLRLMSAISSRCGWETRSSLRCPLPGQADPLCRGSFRAMPRPRHRLLPLCSCQGWGRGLCPLSSSPWGSSPGGWRTALDTQCLLHRGDPARPPSGQFTLRANGTEVFSRIKEYVEFKAWQLFPEHLSCSVGAGDGRHLSFELAGGIQPRQWDALFLSC